jgi:DICT domain-containing protein
MQTDILSSFFQKNMPGFAPRAEAFLKSARASDLQSMNFRYIFTVNGMIEISHLIEDSIISTPGVAETHVSFQYFSRIAAQEPRYIKVADASKEMWLYGIPDTLLPAFNRTSGVDTTGTPLENYWFVIGYGPGFSMTLLAEEVVHGAPETTGEPRLYEGFYTFDANIAYKLLIVLHLMFPLQVAHPTMPELF